MGQQWFMWPMAQEPLILGDSAAVAALRDQIRHLASFDAPRNPHVPTVLLLGETGTGKGLVARTIHESGPRRKAPLIDVNCAAIPENMLEAELFGFEAGAFTDARKAKAGLFETASGGTLFLDEVDALSVPLQSKLLKAIEEKSIRRLGAVTAKQVDVKLVAATQRDLRAMVADGTFRPDLYHRLAVVVLEIPPLRSRGNDILLLARHFLETLASAHGLAPRALAPSATAWLERHPWTGNVRELAHLMERVTLMAPAGDLEAETLERFATPLAAPPEPRNEAEPVAQTPVPAQDHAEPDDEPTRIRDALVRSGGNVVGAARLLGLGRNALRYRMKRHGIERPDPFATPSAPTVEPATDREAEPRAASSATPVAPPPPSTPTWEQKAVTVLAIDATFPDPSEDAPGHEPWTETLHWQEEIAEAVEGFGGVFIHKGPSRVVALFGIPRALEQSSQRAVHAASIVRRLDGPMAPERRIAIHAGVVRIDTAAAEPAAHVIPIGDVLSLPERLLGHAGSGEILLSPVVARRVRSDFDLQDRALQLGPSAQDAVEAASLGSGEAPLPVDDPVQARFVGREREIAFLQEALSAADSASGQVAFVVGDAGLGKSRLIGELRTRTAGRDHVWIEGRCTAYGATSPFLPLVDALRRMLGVDDRDDERRMSEKLSQFVSGLGADTMWVEPYLRSLLSLTQEDETVAALDSANRRSEIFRALSAVLTQLARQNLVVLVIEDLHWIDPESEEFLTFLAELVPASRLLLICSYRPGYRNPFGERSYHLRLALRPLSGGEIAEVVDSLLSADALPSEVRELVARKAEGNPFFVEEVTKSLLEDGSLRRSGSRVSLARDLSQVAVPDTIQEVLMARLDRLAVDARQAIQMASVIGREFALRLLERIVETGGAVEEHLAELRTLELIYEKALHPELAYMFKHALTHEVAYESVLEKRRRELHRTIGAAIEELYADRLAEHYEALAHHYERGEDWGKALDYHARAAVKASESYANRAVIEHCRVGIEIAHRLADAAPIETVVRLHQMMGASAFYTSRFSLSALAFRGGAEAAVEMTEARGALLSLCALAHLWAHEYAACVETIDEAKVYASTHGLDGPWAHARSIEGQYRIILQEDFDGAEAICNEARTLADSSGDEIAIGMNYFGAMLLSDWSGRYDESVANAERIILAGQRTGMANLVVWPTWFFGKAKCCLGQFGDAIDQMKEAYDVCDRIGDTAWKGRLLNTLGWAYAEIGSVELARQYNEQALVFALDLEDVEITGNAQVNLVRNHLALGDLPRALAYLEPVEAEIQRTSDPWMKWRYRLHAQDARAELELKRGELDAALAMAREERAGAKKHRAPKLEARARLVEARTLCRLERWDEAEEALLDVIAVCESISYPRGIWLAHGELAAQARGRGTPAAVERHTDARQRLLKAAVDSLQDKSLRARLEESGGAL